MQSLTFEPDWNKPWYCKNHLDMRGKTLPSSPAKVLTPTSQKPTEDQVGLSVDSASTVPIAATPSTIIPTSNDLTTEKTVEQKINNQPRSVAVKPKVIRQNRGRGGSLTKIREFQISKPIVVTKITPQEPKESVKDESTGLSLSALKPRSNDNGGSVTNKTIPTVDQSKTQPKLESSKDQSDQKESTNGPQSLDPGQTVKF